MTLRKWILIAINTVLIALMAVVSFLFYQNFQSALDERVLQQLTSINCLKRIQIKEYLNQKWSEFVTESHDSLSNHLNTQYLGY